MVFVPQDLGMSQPELWSHKKGAEDSQSAVRTEEANALSLNYRAQIKTVRSSRAPLAQTSQGRTEPDLHSFITSQIEIFSITVLSFKILWKTKWPSVYKYPHRYHQLFDFRSCLFSAVFTSIRGCSVPFPPSLLAWCNLPRWLLVLPQMAAPAKRGKNRSAMILIGRRRRFSCSKY